MEEQIQRFFSLPDNQVHLPVGRVSRRLGIESVEKLIEGNAIPDESPLLVAGFVEAVQGEGFAGGRAIHPGARHGLAFFVHDLALDAAGFRQSDVEPSILPKRRVEQHPLSQSARTVQYHGVVAEAKAADLIAALGVGRHDFAAIEEDANVRDGPVRFGRNDLTAQLASRLESNHRRSGWS